MIPLPHITPTSTVPDVREEWQDAAACAEVGGDLWFPPPGNPAREAKRICRRCTVRTECLKYALDNNEREGIWGGLGVHERRRLRRTA